MNIYPSFKKESKASVALESWSDFHLSHVSKENPTGKLDMENYADRKAYESH